jgi:hypothetical protein
MRNRVPIIELVNPFRKKSGWIEPAWLCYDSGGYRSTFFRVNSDKDIQAVLLKE